MTDDDWAALERGCCSRASAAEKGCELCGPRYAAIDRLRAELDKAQGGLIRHECSECGVEQWARTHYAELICGDCTCKRLEQERDEARLEAHRWQRRQEATYAQLGAEASRAQAAEEALRQLVDLWTPHHGSCVPDSGPVTPETCKCPAAARQARALVGGW